LSKETFEDSEPWSGPDQAIELADIRKKLVKTEKLEKKNTTNKLKQKEKKWNMCEEK